MGTKYIFPAMTKKLFFEKQSESSKAGRRSCNRSSRRINLRCLLLSMMGVFYLNLKANPIINPIFINHLPYGFGKSEKVRVLMNGWIPISL